MTSRPHTAVIALGANLDDRVATLRRAVRRLDDLGTVTAISPVYETAPVGYTDQPAFLNAALLLDTERQPGPLMSALHEIEHDLGRVRSFQNAPRTIDLDLLFYDDMVIDRPDLVVPHPRLHERAFVLVPLNDIAPDLVHPGLTVPISELLRRLGPISDVRRTSYTLIQQGADG